MKTLLSFLSRKRGGHQADFSDWIAYSYLLISLVVVLLPVLWAVVSSFKPQDNLIEFPPTFLPYETKTVAVENYDKPLKLFEVTLENGERKRLAEVKRVGIFAKMIDPENPETTYRINIKDREKIRSVTLETSNYGDPFKNYDFPLYLWNSLFVTLISTVIMLLINSMSAFALSKYEFRGKYAVLLFVVGTLLIPTTVILVPVYIVVNGFGLVNSLWGVILPGAATPTGVFLLRQYMLTIPDELLEAARMDHASEWRIYWRIVMPLTAPALAVLAIFVIIWRWNDFLLPLIVLNQNDVYTLQIALNAFQGELNVQWHYILAMTVVSILPITFVFAFLQRFITSGIAGTGMK